MGHAVHFVAAKLLSIAGDELIGLISSLVFVL